MKLKHRLFAAFFLITIIPSLLTAALVLLTLRLQAGGIKRVYGIDISQLRAYDFRMISGVLVFMLIFLAGTAFILAFWLYRGIGQPIQNLTGATKSIRDGNLDFELRPEGKVVEIRELFEAFEQMRVRLKAANEEKIAFDRQNRELISNISHDLKTPITAVKGYVEGIMDGVADTPEKMERYIRTIYSKANDMDHLINELSFYSKITTNRIPYVFDKVNVKAFFDDAADEIRDELGAKGIQFAYRNTVSEDTTVIADVEQITRVLNNLISNSVKYMDKAEKRVFLDVSCSVGEVRFSVSDNGKGISQKDLANIFERFYRTDSSRNSSAGGSGIGLSIVRKIVEDHGGRVWASSKEGEGTTLYAALREYECK